LIRVEDFTKYFSEAESMEIKLTMRLSRCGVKEKFYSFSNNVIAKRILIRLSVDTYPILSNTSTMAIHDCIGMDFAILGDI